MAPELRDFKIIAIPSCPIAVEWRPDLNRCARTLGGMMIASMIITVSLSGSGKWIGRLPDQTRPQVKVKRLQRLLGVLGRADRRGRILKRPGCEARRRGTLGYLPTLTPGYEGPLIAREPDSPTTQLRGRVRRDQRHLGFGSSPGFAFRYSPDLMKEAGTFERDGWS
jgi:hypothetical protein